MATAPKPAARQPLRPAQIIAQSLAMMFRHFGAFFVVSIVLMLPALLMNAAAGAGVDGMTGLLVLGSSGAGLGYRWIFSTLISVLGALAVTGAIITMAHGYLTGDPVRPLKAAWRGLITLPWVIVFSALIVLLLGAVIGGMVGIIDFFDTFEAGLPEYIIVFSALFTWIPLCFYILARYAPLVPAIVIERRGIRSLARAGELTRDYRWPIVGGVLLVSLLMLLLNLISSTLSLALVFLGSGAEFMPSATGILLFRTIGFVLSALLYALFGTFTALLYARLREIKEGPRAKDLVTVFE